MSKTGDDTTRNLKAYLATEHPVVEPINPKDKKKETPKNDDYNEYEVSDDPNEDDRAW